MIMFVVYAVLLTAVALAILITPLLRARRRSRAAVSRDASNLSVYRDQLAELDADLASGNIDKEQWEAARVDLQRGLLEDAANSGAAAAAPSTHSGMAAIAVAVVVPLIAAGMYALVGDPRGLSATTVAAGETAPHGLSQAQFENLVERLVQRLQSNPNDAEGWTMLARTYSALSRFDEAANAYAKATALVPQNAQLLADYADSLAMAQGQNLMGKPEELIQRALRADGNNLKALALAGSVEFEKQNFAKAAEYWKRMLPLLPPDSQTANSVRASIQEAEGKLGGPRVATAQTKKAGEPKGAGANAAAGGARLSGTVKLAPALAKRAAPDDTVFVLARPAQGPRMPLAAVRVKVKDLPMKFMFDDSMAMSPSNKLSDYSEVVVAARVTKSGNVMPQPGDLEGESKPVHPGTTGMTVVIAEEVK